MLILHRGVGDDIVIGKDAEIVIKVVEIRGDNVRLGIEAPREILIHRGAGFDMTRRGGGRG